MRMLRANRPKEAVSMHTQEKPQPSPAQVKLVDKVLRIVGETRTWVKPAMYPSGTMMLMVITRQGTVRVARVARDGSIISVG